MVPRNPIKTLPPGTYPLLRDGATVGCLVVDSTLRGRSGGGLRIVPRIRTDLLRRAARAMTLKYGLLGLAQGGAKAAVIGAPEGTGQERLKSLAVFVNGFAGILQGRAYAPAADMGTNERLIRAALKQAGVRRRRRELLDVHSGHYTAHSVLASARKAASHLGMAWSGSTAAVEGFGKVGANLALLLQEVGVRVVGVSTRQGALLDPRGLDVKRLHRAGTDLLNPGSGGTRRNPEALLSLPVDFLFPCADSETLHEAKAPQVRARVICPGANCALTQKAESILQASGVFCLPGFLVNAGGVIGGTMEYAGVSRQRISAFVQTHLGALTGEMIEASRSRNVAIRAWASDFALDRFERMKRMEECPDGMRRGFGVALEAYRRGLIPRPVVALLAPAWFRRRLSGEWG